MKVRLNDVRLAFPNLFEARAADDSPNTKAKFSASFIFSHDHPAVKILHDAMVKVAKDKWADKAGEVFKSLKASDRLVIHDGAAKADKYAGYEGNLFINASNTLRPTVLAGDRSPLTVADGKPYSGSYVNAVVELWAQDNKYGKRINASLMGVQFSRDGERLAGGAVASEDDFEEVPEANDEGAANVFDEGSTPDEADPFA